MTGRASDIEQYEAAMDNSSLFAEIQFKHSPDGFPSAFANLRVRVTKEICTLGLAPDAVR